MKLVLGTAQFGQTYGVANSSGQISIDEGRSILEYCRGQGIHKIDTAIGYGTSEMCLGMIGVHDFDVITKISSIPDSCKDIGYWLENEIDCSISRLNIKTLFAVMLHRPQQLFGSAGPDLLEALIKLKRSGKVNKIGVSVYDPTELGAIYSFYEFDIIQAPFNLIDRSLVSTGWLENLTKKGVEVHCRSCFLQGLLTLPRENIPKEFEQWESIWNVWHNWLDNSRFVSPVEACLNFVKSYSDINNIVVGVDSLEQLKQIVAATIKNINVNTFPDISSSDPHLINPSNWGMR